mmetsp:Transcript_23023/g.55491  ORF Transcript_23023/g.55491 Transcript_23023/m.55491 type:complete len:146 (+) Transcript_23023:520-957(+)
MSNFEHVLHQLAQTLTTLNCSSSIIKSSRSSGFCIENILPRRFAVFWEGGIQTPSGDVPGAADSTNEDDDNNELLHLPLWLRAVVVHPTGGMTMPSTKRGGVFVPEKGSCCGGKQRRQTINALTRSRRDGHRSAATAAAGLFISQ